MSLTCTVLLFTVIQCYNDWTHPPLPASDDAASSTPSSPLDTSPAQSPSLRRRTSRRSDFSPRLTTTRPALPFLATETASSKKEDSRLDEVEEAEGTTKQAGGEPDGALDATTAPSFTSTRSPPPPPPSTSTEPVTPSSTRYSKRRTASIASRRSSVSSSVASVGFHPLPAALAPVVQSATDDTSLPHASSASTQSVATSQIGLGRPPSRITASPASPSPHSASTTSAPSNPSRSFSLPFRRRKVSTQVSEKENDLPAMERLRSLSVKKK
ncbi:hypothetical protein AAT19DRAFT_11980 [Rhodotorula toruloides]|uniref:Proteophosphoglycan ppg4 n=1 Tax=Rhodotorula toruloides TaxID=5286 RepID=A0A2T0AEZ4_RHOTO|nr:hypothetical protein AAT19DRAFT_11980 [Rhodotorula toruloides]